MYNFANIVPGTIIRSFLTIIIDGKTVQVDDNVITVKEVFSEYHGVFTDAVGYENAVKVSPVSDQEYELAQTVIEPADYTNVQYINDDKKAHISCGQIYFKQFDEVDGIIEAFLTDEVSRRKFYMIAQRKKI